jgi:hypothetical protein
MRSSPPSAARSASRVMPTRFNSAGKGAAPVGCGSSVTRLTRTACTESRFLQRTAYAVGGRFDRNLPQHPPIVQGKEDVASRTDSSITLSCASS